LIADYFVLRKRQLNLAGLYDPAGEYRYRNGFSWAGLAALGIAILPNLPGFLMTVKVLPGGWAGAAFFAELYKYAWFAGFGIAFVLYLLFKQMDASAAKPGASQQ